jgi:lipopolysaccharide biosynthesis regulator YciM
MDVSIVLIILGFFILLGIAIKMIFFSTTKKATRHDMEIEALNSILAGEKEKALQLLKEIARTDTANTGAYLQVGDLYRQLGNAEAAIRVHQDILERDDISSEMKLMAHERLAKDHEELKEYRRAAGHAEAMLKIDKKNLWALRALHRYAVRQADWVDAIKAFQKENSISGTADPMLPAIYKTEEALKAKTSGNLSEAVSLLKQAIKLNNKCPAPYYHMGRIRQEEGNYKHAIDFYTSFVELDPTAGSIVFSDIEKMYFELGQFEQVEIFYQRLHQKQPDNLEVIIGLANYFERKGEVRDALTLLEDVKTPDHGNLSFVLGHLHLLEKLGHKDALKSAIEDFVVADRQKRILTCPACNYCGTEPSYICKKCGTIRPS